MKMLLMIMAVVEAPIGAALFSLPKVIVPLLLGDPLDTPTGVVVGRLAGAAIFSLAVACWQERNGERGAAMAIVGAMLVYNQASAVLMVYANVRLGLQSLFIWPGFVLHQVLAAWCILTLWMTRIPPANE